MLASKTAEIYALEYVHKYSRLKYALVYNKRISKAKLHHNKSVNK